MDDKIFWRDSFQLAVDDAMSSPQQFASRLFGLRAEGLLNGLSDAEARSTLSGLLIGLELVGARGYWLGQDIAILGDPTLSRNYQAALSQQGASCSVVAGDELSLAGLIAAYDTLEGSKT